MSGGAEQDAGEREREGEGGQRVPDGHGVAIPSIALAREGQAGSCVPARRGTVLGLASASRQRLKTGMPLVGWAG